MVASLEAGIDTSAITGLVDNHSCSKLLVDRASPDSAERARDSRIFIIEPPIDHQTHTAP
jgi:hypothetical protein